MQEILLENKGLITKNGTRIKEPVLGFLGNMVQLEKQFTLSSFFQLISHYPDLRQISPVLNALLGIYEKNTKDGYKTGEIDRLIFYKTIEIVGFPGRPNLKIYTSLKGMTNQTMKNLKFFHIETLLDHALTLGALKHVVFGDTEDVFQYDTFYTLFEFIEGIAWELSFNFNPLQCSVRR